jgi:hypothetical protein
MCQFMITVTALAVFGAMVVTAVTHACAAHRKVRHPAAHARQVVQPVPTKRAVEPAVSLRGFGLTAIATDAGA